MAKKPLVHCRICKGEIDRNIEQENIQDSHFGDIIHHLIIFKPTDKFIKRYKK